VDLIYRLVGLVEFADGVFLVLQPDRWSHFWRKAIKNIGRSNVAPWILAAVEIGFGLYLLLNPPGGRGFGFFRRSSSPMTASGTEGL
jgi:hypothetical protein